MLRDILILLVVEPVRLPGKSPVESTPVPASYQRNELLGDSHLVVDPSATDRERCVRDLGSGSLR